jgi:hypothetical protein
VAWWYPTLGRDLGLPRSQAGKVNPLEVGGNFSIVGLPIAVQVPVGDVGDAREIDPRDNLALGVESRVQLVAGQLDLLNVGVHFTAAQLAASYVHPTSRHLQSTPASVAGECSAPAASSPVNIVCCKGGRGQ